MKLVIILALVASEVFGVEINPLSDEFIDYINSKQSTWTAGRNFEENVPMQELRGLLGGKRRDPKLRPVSKVVHSDDSDIPESFDSREHWPECKDVIDNIADQSHCGSCWAVAATSAMTDRRCIHSNGKVTAQVSALDLLTCLDDGYDGCEGGFPEDGWIYWIQHGLVTGGPYNSSQGCKPYPFEQCDHHIPDSKNPCPSSSETPECKRECTDASLTYSNELTFGTGDLVWITQGEANIQREILTNGPVTASFNVYSDFFNYKSGVYQKVAGKFEGGHVVRIIGWGVENGIPYWSIANSWNDRWGDNGYFKIIRGKNEGDIEDTIMKLVILLALVASEVFGTQLNPLSDEFIDYINSKQSTWTAGRNFDENVSMHDLKRRLLGAKRRDPKLRPVNKVVYNDDSDIPESFDSREQWPECKDVIGSIADQSHCGSCWAVSTTSAMTDRRCIHSKGKVTAPVSALDLLSCLHGGYDGCQGGFPIDGWNYWIKHGLVTGGPYNSSQGCKPYPFEHCDHYVPDSKNPCGPYSPTPVCTTVCDDASLVYENELTFGIGSSTWFLEEKQIQKEILTNGPVTAGFHVYADFFNYKSGIYQHVAGEMQGGHAVRIIGWGVENDIPYWRIANSWNDQWGDHGYFRIIRGKNEVDIESDISAALPKV